MAKQHVSTIINGEPVEYLCEPQQTMLDVSRVGSFERVMHQPEGGPQTVFRLGSSPALPDWRYPRFRYSRIGRLQTFLQTNWAARDRTGRHDDALRMAF